MIIYEVYPLLNKIYNFSHLQYSLLEHAKLKQVILNL